MLYKELKGVQKCNKDWAKHKVDGIRGGRVERNIMKLCWCARGFLEGEEMEQLKGHIQK